MDAIRIVYPTDSRVRARVLVGPTFEEWWVPATVVTHEIDSKGGQWIKVRADDDYEDGTFWARASDLIPEGVTVGTT